MPSQHYDVAVIGTQISGIITAAVLAKRGRRVLLVDHGESATTYGRHGLRLPLVPSLVPLLDTSPAIMRVHDELALGPELRATAKALSPAFQAVMPHHRCDIPADAAAARREFALEFPGLAPAIDAFFTRLFAVDDQLSAFLQRTTPIMPRTLGERLRARRIKRRASAWARPFAADSWFEGIPAQHPVRELLLCPLYFFGHLSPEAPSTFQAVRLIARYFRGTLELGDWLAGVPGMLLRAAKLAGVDIRDGATVKGLEVVGRRISRLEIEDDHLPYTADYFVGNTVSPFHELLPASSHQAKLALEDSRVRAVGNLLVLNLVVGTDVIPSGMAQSVMLLNGRRAGRGDEPSDPPLLVQHHALTKTAGKNRQDEAAEDLSVLTAACPVRSAEVEHSPERLAAAKAQLLARVARLVPFLGQFVRDQSLPCDTSTWDLEDGRRAHRVDPWRAHPLFDTATPPLLGISARSPRTAYKNLWHCGRDVIPGLGLEGEYMSGLATAEAMISDAGRAWATPTER